MKETYLQVGQALWPRVHVQGERRTKPGLGESENIETSHGRLKGHSVVNKVATISLRPTWQICQWLVDCRYYNTIVRRRQEFWLLVYIK